FLYIAKGSCGEVRTQTYLAKELEYILPEDYKLLINSSKALSAKIQNFIKTRKIQQNTRE
ncbi:MAG: four helix bundle protein, partial [Prevotellaceae bacterium]|nr:four helix bundle protein [Prevotellaceae bacterium]